MKKCFPFFSACGGQLEAVDMRHCSLLSVPDEVLRNTRSIEECYLDANQIKDLPKNFFRLTRVKIITISDNELTYIPENIGNFLQLVELDLSRNRINSLHHNIRFCNELRNLDLSNNPINRLPEGFSNLRNLTNLNLIDISLTELPTDFGNLVALQKLELRDNCLRDLPNSFAKLQHLELLDIGGNEFQEFPKPLGKLIELKVLCIENNEIQVIPKEIGTLKNLQELDMSENFLAEIADELGNLSALTDLVLSQNSLDVLPNTLGNLKELSVLKVDQNKLMTLTSQIGECTKLEELYLTENFIQRLPGTMGKLSQLVHLKVDQNHLTAIPSELIKCDQITIMSFRGNRIRKLPADIGFMSNLHVLDVSNNLLERLPISIAECPLKALWLSENQSQSLVKLQRDVDSETKEEFLTCYLLPQSGTEDLEQMQNLEPSDAAKSLPYDFRVSTNSPDHTNNTSVMSAGGSQHHNTISAAGPPSYSTESCYPTMHESEMNHDVSQGSFDQVKVRFNDDSHTPSNRVSKENLPKTRHPKLDKKAIDGHIIPKETHTSKDLKFAPNRHSSHDHKVAQYRTKKISAPPGMAPNPNSFRLTTENGAGNNLQSVMETDMLVKRSHSDAGLPQSEMGLEHPHEHENGGGSSSDGSMRVKHDHTEDGDNVLVKPRKHRHGVKMDDNVQDISMDSHDLTSDNRHSSRSHYRELTTYSSGGEEIDGINRRVEFSNETEDNEETGLRLIRRDTPHYTKKARIHDVSADGTKNEDVVKQIMEKLKQSPSPLPGQQGGSSGPHSRSNSTTDPHQPIVQMRTSNQPLFISPIHHSAPTYDQVIAASALARGSNVPPGLQCATRSTEEMQIRVVREPGEQLGMSIAGGIGSSPHKPVFVSRLTDTGAAHKAGLMVNDRILEVNGVTFIDIEHGAAVSVLKNAGMSFDMVVQRDYLVAPPPLTTSTPNSHYNNLYSSSATSIPSKTVTTTGFSSANVTGIVESSSFMVSPNMENPSTTYSSGDHTQDEIDVSYDVSETLTVDVSRDENGLGFSIAGGKGSMGKELSDQRWAFLESIYVCKISPHGAADKSKKLQVGDKIIKINGIDVSDARHDQAVVLLSGCENNIRLVVQRQVIMPRSGSTAPASDVPDLSESSSTQASNFNLPQHYTPQPVSEHAGINDSFNYDKYDEANKKVVKIVKTSGQLGLSICGGIDHCAHPFGIDRPGIFINKISATGAANACGKLQIGDRILTVNGHDIRQATHDEAIVHFIQSSSSEIVLEVIHEPQPPGFQKLTIIKELKEKLGINIQGGNDGYSMNPDDPKDKGIFITKILSDGAVFRDGRLKVGHRLIEVNSRSFMGIPLNRATKVLVEVTTQMDVIVCDGISPDKIELALSRCNNTISPDLASNGPAKSPGSISPVSWKNRESPSHSVNPQISPMPISVPHSSRSSSPSTHTNNHSSHINSVGMTSRHSKTLETPDDSDRSALSVQSKRKFFEGEIRNQTK